MDQTPAAFWRIAWAIAALWLASVILGLDCRQQLTISE
jgi:hypothetical protein